MKTTVGKMNYPTARSAIFEGQMLRRASWAECRNIRRWEQRDSDHVGYFPDMIVEDCPKQCDCQIGPFIATAEDQLAEDWQLIIPGGDVIRHYLEVRIADGSANKVNETENTEVFHFDNSFYIRSKQNHAIISTGRNEEEANKCLEYLIYRASKNIPS